MYKIETHLHTSEVSPCSRTRAIEMIRMYKDAGYSTVFVSDHFQENTIDTLGDIPWTEKTAIFFAGYYKAKCEGDKLGITVLPAAEFKFADACNHYLAYGITKEFLDAYPNIHNLTIAEFSQIAKSHNLFVIQAHPYRDGKCYPTPDFIDGIEVYNSNPRHEDLSEKSEKLARELNLLVTAGSDAHRTEDVALSGIISEYEIKTTEDFVKLIKSRKAVIIK